MADGWVNSVSFAEAQRLWCCAVLGRWLQLYMLGDPENAEAELADELAGIYKDALPTTKSMFSSLPASFLHHSLPSPLALYDKYILRVHQILLKIVGLVPVKQIWGIYKVIP